MIFVAHIQMDILEAYYIIISQILIATEVLISTFTKNDKKAFLEKIMRFFFSFLENVLIVVYTTYIQKKNQFPSCSFLTRILP